ncbi:holo-ACP synthase [Streptomyces triticagri]|uniref:Holo-[acyl-carrier-protein] synthase n=1 Tax=Streptomyces triticagri TaxID=2293568 RepID=A0A372LXH2_9ACTN|nr:holo-ACP synthase [Streptomyces triticagri]RFU83331.1 holo-ACP synthase [Streptomyces triticagri]
MGVGVDLVQLGELDRLLGRDWFRAFVYTDRELGVAAGFGPDRAREFLAGRFAAKEAVLKAIGTGMTGGVRPCQVSVLPSDRGVPVVRLAGPAAERASAAGVSEVRVSLSHKRGLAFAVALALDDAGRPMATA